MTVGALLLGCSEAAAPAAAAPNAVAMPHRAEPRGPSALEVRKDPAAKLAERSQRWLDRRECALSCHTTHAFLLASPHLGAAASDTEAAILKRVEARVAAWPNIDPWYDSTSDKAAQSRATESVLNAAVLTVHDRPAATRAAEIMFEQQREDGGWTWLDFGLAPWETSDAEVAGAALAAIVAARGDQANAAGVDRLRGYLRRAGERETRLHHQLALLWAAQSFDGAIDTATRSRLVAAALQAQRSDGGWSSADLGHWPGAREVAGAKSDAYATGLATLALAQAGEAGADEAVSRGKAWLRKHQRRDGTWRGRSLVSDSKFNGGLAGDLATAFAVMALAADS